MTSLEFEFSQKRKKTLNQLAQTIESVPLKMLTLSWGAVSIDIDIDIDI